MHSSTAASLNAFAVWPPIQSVWALAFSKHTFLYLGNLGTILCVWWAMQRMFRYGLVFLFSSQIGLSFAQKTTPSLNAAHISPTLYFPSAPDEVSSRAPLQARVAAKIHQLPSASAAQLADGLDGVDELSVALQRHLAYIKVQALENSDNQALRAGGDQIAAAQTQLDAAVAQRLRAVPSAQIASLGRYAYLAQQLQGDTAHGFSPDAESYRGAVTIPLEASLSDSYDRVIESLGKGGKEVGSPDAAKRRVALAARKAVYDQAAPAVATLLGTLVEVENRDAIAQGYANAAERKYESLGLNSALVDRMVASVQSQAPVYRRYEQVRAEHTAKALSVSAPLADEQDIASAGANQISLAEAREMVLASLKPLGRDYTQRFTALLDPANGRLDLEGGTHRAETGTSISAYDAPTALYYEGYQGSLRDVSKITHEGGHTIHRELMNSSGLPVYEREGPHYLFESYAIFNELLLLDQATRSATTPGAREYALERFVSAEETSFEKNLYTQAAGHAMLDRAKVDAIFQSSIQPYEFYPMTDAGVSRNWMRKSLVFEDPLYLVNYLYASVIAVALFDKAHSDPGFAEKYAALLRRGFDADPQMLLATMDIRLDDPHLVEGVAYLFEQKTNELQGLYAGR
jgi:oligoendopeptidase F